MNKVLNVDTVDFSKEEMLVKIAVDTNVLLFLFYSRISFLDDSDDTRKRSYQNFVASILKLKNVRLYTSAINLNEALHVIEKTECEIYNSNLVGTEIDLKSYRKQSDNSSANQKQFKLLYRQVCKIMQIIDYEINKSFIKDYIDNYKEYCYDCMDAAFSDCCKKNGIKYILTNDIDFAGLEEGIDVLTANSKAFQ